MLLSTRQSYHKSKYELYGEITKTINAKKVQNIYAKLRYLLMKFEFIFVMSTRESVHMETGVISKSHIETINQH